MLNFSSPEVGSPGSVMSFLNIVETWSGKGTLGADLHTSHLGRLVGKNLVVGHGQSIFGFQGPCGVRYLGVLTQSSELKDKGVYFISLFI